MKLLNIIGGVFSRIIFQNISALMALGIFRALFSPVGWFPNPYMYGIINPVAQMLIPILCSYTGGKMLGGHRGGVIASFAVFGIIANTPTAMPVILPAIVFSLLVGAVIKKMDRWLEDRIPTGFELLFYNAAAGCVGVCFALIGYFIIAPLFAVGMNFLSLETEHLVQSGYLPLLALVIEPGKVLFFNNIINHGVLEPLGIHEVKEAGKSIFFLLETNPGPGFGLLLAIYLYTKKEDRGNVRSSMLIQFFGGIHEVYFPYALMKPLLIIPLILGGLAGDFVFYALHTGLVATPSPGSIFLLLALAPRGQQLLVLLGVIVSGLVSLLSASYILALKRENMILDMEDNRENEVRSMSRTSAVRTIVFACDAGMGSSAMGAAFLRKQVKKMGLCVEVSNASVDDLPSHADVVISHHRLIERARSNAPHAEHYSIHSFVDEVFYQRLIEELKPRCIGVQTETEEVDMQHETAVASMEETDTYCKLESLPRHLVVLNNQANDKWEAIRQAGTVLMQAGYVSEGYLEEMYERELSFSTYLANGVAIPHGLDTNSSNINKTGMALLQYPNGVDFGDGNIVHIIIAVAAQRKEQLGILSYLAGIVSSEYTVECLIRAQTYEEIIDIIVASNLELQYTET